MDGDTAAPGAWRQPTFALAGGLLVAFSMPPWGFWPLAFVGIAVFEWALGDEPSRRRRALAGFAFGAGWLYVSMAWMWFLTVPGYLLACAAFAGYHAAAAAIAPTGRWRAIGRPAAHTVAEALRFVFPFGGVPLASLGIAQADGPFVGLARVGGVLLITWFVFQVGFAITSAVRPAIMRLGRSAPVRVDPIPIIAVGVAALVVVVAAVAPRGSDLDLEPMTIAAVQGGGEQGTTALDVPSRVVTERHLEATRTIEPSDELDLVVWPENGIDIDDQPFADSDAFEAVAAEAARLGVPIAVGVTIDSEFSEHPVDGSFVNAQALVLPDGRIGGWYEKVHIVPFGEYVPFRRLFEALGAPLENVAGDATRGQGPAYLVVDRDGAEIRLGVMISWEVFFGHRGLAAADSTFLINPTNGASYTWTILQTQQVASSRLRAAETGRWVVQVSPTGFSAFVSPDGDVLARTGVSEQAVIVHDVPLRGGTTWYAQLGDRPWVVLAALTLAIAWWATRRSRRVTVDPHLEES